MGRIRTIKPEFPQSESMGRVSRDARLLFVLLWTLVDDSGRTRAASRMLASLLFPYDDDAPKLIDGWLAELQRERCIVIYEHDGSTYLEICKWASHQKIDRPTPSKFPPFDGSSRVLASPRESSSLDLDQGPRTKDQGPGLIGSPPEAAPDQKKERRSVKKPDDISDDVWADWKAARKGRPVTQHAWDLLVREAKVAGVTPAEAVKIAAENSWQGFKAEWLARSRATTTIRTPAATAINFNEIDYRQGGDWERAL